jgi:hypothetical protein
MFAFIELLQEGLKESPKPGGFSLVRKPGQLSGAIEVLDHVVDLHVALLSLKEATVFATRGWLRRPARP